MYYTERTFFTIEIT